MNKAQRQKWHGLVHELDRESSKRDLEYGFTLCNFCRYAHYGYGSDEDGPECSHPVEKIRYQVEDMATGYYDCWAFRPRGDIEGQRTEYLDQLDREQESREDCEDES